MILSLGSYVLYPAGTVIFRVNNRKLELSSNKLGISLFCKPRNHFLAVANELMESIRDTLKSLTKLFGKHQRLNTFLVEL